VKDELRATITKNGMNENQITFLNDEVSALKTQLQGKKPRKSDALARIKTLQEEISQHKHDVLARVSIVDERCITHTNMLSS